MAKRLSEKQKKEIAAACAGNKSKGETAQEIGVSISTINRYEAYTGEKKSKAGEKRGVESDTANVEQVVQRLIELLLAKLKQRKDCEDDDISFAHLTAAVGMLIDKIDKLGNTHSTGQEGLAEAMEQTWRKRKDD